MKKRRGLVQGPAEVAEMQLAVEDSLELPHKASNARVHQMEYRAQHRLVISSQYDNGPLQLKRSNKCEPNHLIAPQCRAQLLRWVYWLHTIL